MYTIVSLCKRRGSIFPSSEIYGGLGSTWDYGPLGVELKNNVKRAWWKAVVQQRDDMVGLDAAILMHPEVWIASGHVAGFSDPMVECKNCNQRFRANDLDVFEIYSIEGDRFIGLVSDTNPRWEPGMIVPSHQAEDWVQQLLQEKQVAVSQGVHVQRRRRSLQDVPIDKVPCPTCRAVGTLTKPRMFNLMFKTFFGPVEDEASEVYLRPETAQGIFVNFQNVLASTRKKLPFGIAQIGKAFRNEITPGNFTFRTREFEQMEIEYFVKPGTDEEWLKHWTEERVNWYLDLGIRKENLRLRPHGDDELAHYARACYDIEYLFPMGWSELEGIANRTDFDLRMHAEHSGKDLSYFDDETKERYLPYVIEPSAGVDRSVLAFLVDAYHEEEVRGEKRVVLRLDKRLAPIKVAVLPLSRNERLRPTARKVYDLLRKHWMVQYDDAQSIGRRYRRQDEIGTPFAVTIDFDTLEDHAVTIRERDSMEQVRVPIEGLVEALRERLD